MNCPECGNEVDHQRIPEDESHCDLCDDGVIPGWSGVGFWCWCTCHAWNDDLRLIEQWQRDPISTWEH